MILSTSRGLWIFLMVFTKKSAAFCLKKTKQNKTKAHTKKHHQKTQPNHNNSEPQEEEALFLHIFFAVVCKEQKSQNVPVEYFASYVFWGHKSGFWQSLLCVLVPLVHCS